MTTLVAGVDSSTQSCKVVIIDVESGAVVRQGRATHPSGTSVDPEEWWRALRAAIAEAGGLDDVSAISIGGQQHGMVVLDADGRVIRDALLWNDTRSAQAATDLIAEFGATALAERTGTVPVASLTSTKLRWLRDAEPENAARVAAVALPHDWLTWRLAGYGPAGMSELGPDLDALATDASDASGTGYFNPVTGKYDRELLIASLGHDAVLPRVVKVGESAGATSGGVVLGPGAGDNAAAALGLDARPGDVVISIGTSGTAFAVAESLIPDSSGTVAGFSDATGNRLPLVATLNAARVMVTIAELLGVNMDGLAALALAAPSGSGGLTLVPYFEGERTPNLPHATATLTGMTMAATTRENLARAAIEGMLSGLAAGVAALERQGVTTKRIVLIGGGAQSPAVQAIAGVVFSHPVTVPEPGEYVALGAARQAAWALTGVRPSWPISVAGSPVSAHDPAVLGTYAQVASAIYDI